jgi:aminoglycoside phosphotransferase (APT) family kinase protein
VGRAAPSAALRHESRVPEALHEFDKGLRNVHGIPARAGRLAREPVARHRRDHDVERVRRARAVRRRIGERADDLQLLDDRARPSVTDDDRQRVLVLRANVDEVDVEPL